MPDNQITSQKMTMALVFLKTDNPNKLRMLLEMSQHTWTE